MARSLIAAAVDEVAVRALGPSLSERGFRRRGRTWSRQSEAVAALVTVLSHRYNSGVTGLFTVEVGVSYLGLGEAAPHPRSAAACAHWCRIGTVTGTGVDLWWQIDDVTDPGELARVTAQVREVWQQEGLALVDALDDPHAYLALLSTPRPYGRGVRLAEIDLLVRLGDTEAATLEVQRELDQLLERSRRPPTAADPHPLPRLLPRYAWLLPRLTAVGMQLPPEHLQVVRAGFAEAEAFEHAVQLPATGPAKEHLDGLALAVATAGE